MKIKFWILVWFLCSIAMDMSANTWNLPEIYQDVLIKGKVVQQGIRSCADRYEAIKPFLKTLPHNFKSVDIGASQGYFSFRMAEDFKARCTMIEGGYTKTDVTWDTGAYLQYLCTQNSHLQNITLLQKLFALDDFIKLKMYESFDVVIAFAVIHHMKKHDSQSNDIYSNTIDAILDLAPVVFIENPINTGDHTRFIRKELQKRKGRLIYQSPRGSLTYEIYVFDRREECPKYFSLPNISKDTYTLFNGTYI